MSADEPAAPDPRAASHPNPDANAGVATGAAPLSDDALLALPTVYRADLFAGRTILVSGAGTGIGKAIACLFGRLGGRVVLCGRSGEKLEATRRLLERVGTTALAIPTNIREPEQVDALFARIEAEAPGLDVVVNNAGGQYPQASIDLSDKGWRAVVDTNLNGTWTMMQRAARFWKRRATAGSIVNVVAPYRRGMYGLAHTVAARAAVAHLAQNLAVEWAPDGIRINCVLPGPIATEGLAVYSEEARSALARSNPLRRLGDVQDIAEACAYLSADSGKFITGEVLVVDGGHQHWGELWMAGRPPGYGD
ncbi:MAG: SDR family oxidoreductase [Deltaproteobacteria bacterium]|nr:SDR family oxidoreductase [Deltaproteobacteria bacterium]